MRLLAVLTMAVALNASDDGKARFTPEGDLVTPANYREWVFLSSGLGMTYGPNAPAAGSRPRFDNVFVNPSSYREFLKTGTWPDGTVLILEVRESESKGSINQHGHFQSKLVAVEANVRDSKRFPDRNWAFFDLPVNGERTSAKPLPAGNGCQQCHSTNGAVDGTFVQFYPGLIPVAEKFGTFRRTGAVAGH